MRQHSAIVLFCLLIAALLLSVPAPTPAAAAEAPPLYICDASEEFTEIILRLVGERKEYFRIALPKTLPEANGKGTEQLKSILQKDSGMIRWGHRGTGVKKIKINDYVVFDYVLTYHTTQEQDDAARKLAAGIVSNGDLRDLSDREKVEWVGRYISDHWRYDDTLNNRTAYAALRSQKGTCLGLTSACQFLLNEMDIPSQTVHGKLTQTNQLHIRLLVKQGDWWYVLDPTHIAREKPDLSVFLKTSHGKQFVPETEYLTASFRRIHPMSAEDLSAAESEGNDAA